jgi:carboxymethylenebutenolidase
MGGGFALLAASDFDASAPYYGMLPTDQSILDDACPIVASFGAKDRTLPGAADTLREVLTERAVTHDVKEYPEAGHSFANRR